MKNVTESIHSGKKVVLAPEVTGAILQWSSICVRMFIVVHLTS